jgi:hypothetical protein
MGSAIEVSGFLPDDALAAVVQLWGVPIGTLETSVCMQPLLSREGLMIGVQPANRSQVLDTIRTSSVSVYNLLVDAIVTRMNSVLSEGVQRHRCVRKSCMEAQG